MKLRYDKVDGEITRTITFEDEEITTELGDKGWIVVGEDGA